MAAGTESSYPQDWFRLAAKDFKRVAKRLAEDDSEDAAFRLQQALEKYLKGYLLSRGWVLKRIHDVESLLSESIRYDAELERYRTLCQQVAGYYLVDRYPMFEEGPSLAEVRSAYTQAKELVRRVSSRKTSAQ